jgi:hypothetical protein
VWIPVQFPDEQNASEEPDHGAGKAVGQAPGLAAGEVPSEAMLFDADEAELQSL